MMKRLSKIYELLTQYISPERVMYDEAVSSAYVRDSSFLLSGIANTDFIVVQPVNVQEIQYIVRIANENKLKLLVKSMGTNLVGAAIPHNIDIVIDLKRMKYLKIDPDYEVAIVEPGVTHGELAREARKYNFKYIGPLAPHSASVIGNIAYTSMKPGAVRYGQDQVLALEVVLPDGNVLRTGCWAFPELTDVPPYYRHAPLLDLNFLFLFTRGVFGIITKAAIRLFPMQEYDQYIVAYFNNINNMTLAAIDLQHSYIPSQLLSISGTYLPRFLWEFKYIPSELINADILIVEVEGTKKQVDVNSEIVTDIIKRYGGKITDFIPYDELMKMLSPSVYSPRMLQPYGAMLPIVIYLPTKYVAPYIINLRKAIKDLGFESEYVIYYQYLGQNAYVEIDVHYDPLNTSIDKIKNVLNAASIIKRMYKGCSTSLSEFEKTGMYYELALKIKKLIDPNDILNPMRLFRGV